MTVKPGGGLGRVSEPGIMTSPSSRERKPSFCILFFSLSVMRDLSQSHWGPRSSSSVAAGAAGRGAVGGFPPAAAAELEDPLWPLLFFTMVAVAELSAFSLWVDEKEGNGTGASEQGEGKNPQVLNINGDGARSWPSNPEH